RPLDWEALQSAVPPDVALVEDAAGALGARWRGMPCGGLGVLSCLSFHPRKIVTTGEGGAVTPSDDALAGAVGRLRPHGTALRGEGIEVQIGTYALHRLGAFHDQGPFPGADRCFERALALPLHSRLTEEDIDLVCGALTTLVS